MSQTKFKEGDLVYLNSSTSLVRTIETLRGNDDVLVWECPISYQIHREVVSLPALRLSEKNPRTTLKIGDVVFFKKANGEKVYATVSEIKPVDFRTSSTVVCKWFVRDELNHKEIDSRLVEKLFEPLFSLYAIIVQDDWDEEREVFLGSYTTHEEAVKLVEGFSKLPVPEHILDTRLVFNDVTRENPDIFGIKYKKDNRRVVFTTKILNQSL